MTIDSWLASASADADRRGLPALKPLLDTLARSSAALRTAHAAIADADIAAGSGAASHGHASPKDVGGTNG